MTKHLNTKPEQTWTVIRTGANAENYVAKNLATGEEGAPRDSYDAAYQDIPTGRALPGVSSNAEVLKRAADTLKPKLRRLQ